MTFDRDLFKRALDFAAAKHGDQRVPGSGFPDVVHVTKVAMEVLAATEEEPGFDRDLALTCALLHDTVEDAEDAATADATRAEIRSDFGARAADGVEALTKTGSGSKAEQMRDSLRRISAQPREVWLVKLADRITNLEPPPADWPLEKRRRYLEEAKEILVELGSGSPALSRRFEQKLEEYRAFCGEAA
jgi:(p)ppGpp synthase/HD superfamily hydrolase